MALENSSPKKSADKKDTLSADEIKQKIKNLKDKKVVIVNAEDIAETEARDAADITLAKEKHASGIFGKITKTLFYNYNRQKKLNEIKDKIKKEDNVYAGQDDSGEAHKNAMSAIAERFSSEYEELVDKKGGEEKKLLDNKTPEGINTTAEIKKIIIAYARGELNDVDFKEERNRIIGAISDENIKGASSFADNLLEKAQEVKILVEHGIKLEELDLDFEVIVGKAKSSIKTEAKYNTVDKILDKMEKVGITKYVSPTTLSLAVGFTYTVAAATSKTLLRSKALAWGTFGATAVVSGVLMGANESKRLADERRQHQREMAKGGVIEDGSKRREEMEEHAYATIDARKSIDEIEALLYDTDKEGKKVLKNLSENDIRSAMAKLGDLEARDNLAELRKVDLINYSSLALAEKERTEMDIMRAKAKAELRRLTKDEKFKDIFGKQDFDEYIDSLTKSTQDALQGGELGLDAKDKAFRKMQIEKSLLKGVKTALWGATIGGTVQEIKAYFDDDVEGVIEGMFSKDHTAHGGATIQTPLEHLRGIITGHPTHLGGPSIMQNIDGHNFNLPQGASMLKNPDGTFDITLSDRVIGDNIPITFNPDGTLSPESIELLGEEGIVAEPGHDVTYGDRVEGELSADDYIKNHPGSTNTVHRDLWYDNDTPKPVFDKNELKLHWGGGHNSGINEHGQYVFNVKHMVPKGSFHDSFNVDAQDKIKNHGLKMLLSLTRGTQTHPFEVDIDADGNAIIDPDSEVGKLFFSTENGHAVFHGRYAEVAEMMDTKDGVDNVRLLATYEGPGRETIPDIIDTTCTEKVIDLDLPLDDEPPYFIPIMYRNPLEPLGKRKPKLKPDPVPSTDPGILKIERMSYGGYMKEYFTDLGTYRNTDSQIEQLIAGIPNHPKLKEKYKFLLERLKILRNYKNEGQKVKAMLLKETYVYNRRYSLDRPITVDNFVEKEIRRIYHQVENIYIDNANEGEKPYSKEFYDKSPIIKGIKDCDEVVVVLPVAIGDAVLSVPIINSVYKYFALNNIDKKVKVMTKQPGLFKCLEDQFPNLEIISNSDAETYFKRENKKRFIINSERGFEKYDMFNISDAEVKDPSKVMSVDWASWMKEESPVDARRMTKYDPLPARIARTFEVMTGQKLFKDIKNTDKYIEKDKNFDVESKEIKNKYNIKDDEIIITISAGSSVTPKEYSPAKWIEVINGIYAKYPKAHILFLDDPEPTRKARYGEMVDKLVAEKGYAISRSDDQLNKMNTIMSMSDVVITPDTGLGHYAAALGKKTIMLYLSDPVLWSAPGVKRVIHGKGFDTYRKGEKTYNQAWDQNRKDDYYVEDDGVMVGASDITPEQILKKMDEVLKPSVENVSTQTEKAKKTRAFFELVAKDEELKKKWGLSSRRYFAFKNFKNIKEGDEDFEIKKEIEEIYEEQKKNPGNENMTIEEFLQGTIGLFDDSYSKKFDEIQKNK